jgi:hypothetical protein
MSLETGPERIPEVWALRTAAEVSDQLGYYSEDDEGLYGDAKDYSYSDRS